MINKKIASVLLVSLFVFAGCASGADTAKETAEPQSVPSLVFYSWPEDGISTVFEAFTAETGIPIIYETYDSQEEAIENIQAGNVYDIVVMENQFIPSLVTENLLAEINFQNVPNFKSISPNFRDLTHDPGNKHTIPYSWGTTGLVVRNDLIVEPVTSWADMWDTRYQGQVISWANTPRFAMGAVLLSLGYSVNSENPAELEEALARLLELDANVVWLNGEESVAPYIVSGEAVMALGWAYDIQLAQEEIDTVSYILPEEGTILWGDNFVIPANSENKEAAEQLLNFILRPEISGQIININYYPMANELAKEFVDPEILEDPIIYPTNEALANAEILLPLSPEGEQLHADIWARFFAESQ